MYEIFKNVINSKEYSLEDILKKIDTKWVQSELTDEQRDELIALAQANANPENSNAPLQKQIEEIAKQVIALQETIANLSATVQKIKETVESGGTIVPEPEPTPQEECPAWEPYNWHSTSKISDRL